MAVESLFEIGAEELVEQVESGSPVHILDVRAEQRLAAGSVDIVGKERFFNIRGSVVLQAPQPRELGLDPAVPWVVVCGLGNDSLHVARHLAQKGLSAKSLTGGMSSWMGTLVPRQLDPGSELDLLVQFDRIGKGALGYLLGGGGEALLVDPPRAYGPMLRCASEAGLAIKAVADTHAHADYISGGPALAAELGVPYLLHPADSLYPYDGRRGELRFQPLDDGQGIEIGGATIRVEHTPGHTEGSVTYRLGDDFALTGDFVFVDSVGRPDLGGKVEEWTGVLFSSLDRARGNWPGSLRIYPAHYASDAERAPDRSVGSDKQSLLSHNEPFGILDGESFSRWILERVRPFPDSYKRIKAINIGLHSPTDQEAEELEAGRNQCALG